jgi:hypothetical protein
MLGHLTSQKQMLILLRGAAGNRVLLTFQMPLSSQSTQYLFFADHGVPIQTLQPVRHQTTALIFSQDHKTTEAARAAACRFGALPDARPDTVELIGAVAEPLANETIQ